MKKYRKISQIITLFVAMAAFMFSCVDDNFDIPPITQKPIGAIYTIQQVKDSLASGTYQFKIDASVYATVTMDNETDNCYKTFYIQDNTAAIAVFQDVSGGVYIGDSVRVYLKDLVVMKYSELFQLNTLAGTGINIEANIIKQGYNNKRVPENTTLAAIEANPSYWQGRLVKISDVQFVSTDTSKTYAISSTTPPTNVSLYIQDSIGKQLIVRTSGYASFADSKVPNGSGSIIAIVGQYNSDIQLVIRKASEVVMENERFEVGGIIVEEAILFEDFSSLSATYAPITILGWKVVMEAGTIDWHGDGYNGQSAEISAFGSTDASNIAWLITPSVDLSATTAPYLSFYSALKYYAGNILSVYVSTDYDGGNSPQTATWTELTSANIVDTTDPLDAASGYYYTVSGNVDLSAYKSSSVYIAFKYVGSSTLTTKYRVDNIKIAEL